MNSIYEKALGESFAKLHPNIQRRFGFSSEDGVAAIGTGIMEKVWYGKWYTLPFLCIGTCRNILFPQSGTNIPFTIENYAYKDSLGRETVTWIRTYQFPRKTRRFDATMIYSEQRKQIIDYLGTHQHLAVEIEMEPTKQGGMALTSGEQYFYEGKIDFKFPMLLSGYASVCEWYDEEINKFRIDVKVTNKVFGAIFGYSGYFDVEYINMQGQQVPQHVKPIREEARE
ncbi:MAG TPA: DUF4166 domain-containing protein [Candidatus Paenibacillus intestinavium]|nr:DUF4166 domain-containing protein [Candidatus Paenibacillus intestinavium]